MFSPAPTWTLAAAPLELTSVALGLTVMPWTFTSFGTVSRTGTVAPGWTTMGVLQPTATLLLCATAVTGTPASVKLKVWPTSDAEFVHLQTSIVGFFWFVYVTVVTLPTGRLRS